MLNTMKKKSKQPYRLWFQYLQTCLNDEVLSKKVNRDFYKSWHLNKVKTQKFDTWFKEHSHLFEEYDTDIKLYNSKDSRTPNTLLVEIPKNYSVRQIQNEIGSVLKGRLNQSNARFSITSNKPLRIETFDYFLWCWQWKQMTKYQVRGGLEMIWTALHTRVQQRQQRYSKAIAKRKIKGRAVSQSSGNVMIAIMISRNIKNANNILLYVCKGQFPGLKYN